MSAEPREGLTNEVREMTGIRPGRWGSNGEVAKLTDRCVMQTYGRFPIAPVRGESCRLWDADGMLNILDGVLSSRL